MKKEHGNTHYIHLLLMAVLTFSSMYVLMYAMVDTLRCGPEF
jgi:hypothetical protein